MNHLLQKAEKARQGSQFRTAQRIYQSLLRQSSNTEEKAEALLGLADVERIQGFFTEALTHYQKAARLLKKTDPLSKVDAQVGWALAARAVGRPVEALRELKKALAFYGKEKDRAGEAFTHWALGGTWRIAGDMRKGLGELKIALRMFKGLKDSEGISYVCCALGGIFRMLGRYAESGRYYREANRRMRQRKDTFGIAYSYCGLGNVQRMARRFKQALPFYKKAEKLYGTIGDRVSYAYTLWSIGTTYKMLPSSLMKKSKKGQLGKSFSHLNADKKKWLGFYDLAWEAFKKADTLFKKTGDTRGRIYTLLGFAEVGWLKERENISPPRHQDTKKGFYYWSLANRLADKSPFPWEELHSTSLLNAFSWTILKAIRDSGHFNKPKTKKIKTTLVKFKSWMASRYEKFGSKFYPTTLPINWP